MKNKTKIVVIAASLVLVGLVSANMYFGHLSPCQITRKLMTKRVLAASTELAAAGNPFASLAEAGGLGFADRLISEMTPLQCVKTNFRLLRGEEIQGPLNKEPNTGQTAAAVPVRKWDEQIDKSPVDDSESVLLIKESNNKVNGSYGDEIGGSLGIVCKEGQVGLVITSGEILDYNYSTHETDVTIRLDDEKAFQQSFNVSSSSEALRSSNSKSDILEWSKHKKVLVRYYAHGPSERTFIFDMAGLNEKLPRLQKACNWRPESP